MIKAVYCLVRRKDLSFEEFSSYWREHHGRLARECKPALNARKYVQSHTSEPALNEELRASRDMRPAFDGITEMWWDSADDLRAALATPEGAKAMQDLLEDEKNFVDLEASCLFMTEEHDIF